MNSLATGRFIVRGGPLGNGERVLHIVEAESEQAIRERLAHDPWEKMSLLQTDSVESWNVLLDRDLPKQPHAGNAHVHTRSLLKPLIAVACGTVFLLLIPLVAMQFTTEVNWGPEDLLHAGCLIFVTGVGVVLVNRYIKRTGHRVALIGILALVFAIVWAELAVGIFS